MSDAQTKTDTTEATATETPVGDEVGTPAETPAGAAKSDDAQAKAPIQPTGEIIADDDDAPDSLMGEFMLFLKEEKKWWLAPLVIVLLLLSAVIIFAEGSAIAPFIYTIF